MSKFQHQRHKPPDPLHRERELIVACAPLRSQINFSRILRTAGCCGVRRVIGCGTAKAIGKVARDAAVEVRVEVHRTLGPVLAELRSEGYELVGVEQAAGSESLHTCAFQRRTALVIGNERSGLTQQELDLLDRVVEIPVWGLPHSYNVATAASMALYEYCRQFPTG
jgi:tRNA G18 (ribose-2'-O)-methylase SpoU